MQRHEVQAGILHSWSIVDELSLGETISTPIPLAVNYEFRDLVLRSDLSYVKIYMTGLRLSHYNFLLTDYSYFQFTWSADGCVRYGYYPNPYVVGRENTNKANISRWHELLAAEMITLEEYLTILSESKPDIRVPPIRYENAPDQYVALQHPCSHLHIGHHAENRWALNRVLTPPAFTLWILKLYYGYAWEKLWIEEKGRRTNKCEAKLIEERSACSLVDDGRFIDDEKRSFHFS